MSNEMAAEPRDLSDVSDDELTARFRGLELELRRREAEMAAVVAEAERRALHRADGHRGIGNWMRAHANSSGAQVTRRRRLARLLSTVPAAAEALREGRIGVAQADELARVRSNPRCGHRLADDPDLAALLAEQCEQLSFEDARLCLRRWETLADEDGAHRDRAANEERRNANVIADHDGLTITVNGGSSVVAAEVEAVFEHFVELEFRRDVAERAAVHGANGPHASTSSLPRTAAQRRFDGLVTMVRAAAADPEHAPSIPLVLNLVGDPVTVLNAFADHGLINPADPHHEPDPARQRCETADGTLVHPDDLVRAALGGHVRRVVTDASGVIVDAGRRRRLFTGVMRDLTRIMIRRCQHPGCTVPGRRTEVDHLDEWHADGHTLLENAGLRCGVHNRSKHRDQLSARRTAAGTVAWYRPDGTLMSPVGRRPVPGRDEAAQRVRERVDRVLAGRPPPGTGPERPPAP